ncbi:MAG TPA: corrinoid protein [Bacillota bacterium]|jgi:trimethylamine corrinoid protein|nr:dimethylamine corrinoid protein 3 [Bacillota bacterium]HOA35746.1 corrinoid protein [Bacillota bacterium]HOJ85138.1 corrinoid protein [Bacillota bacterium]HOL16954.1 corrinoid protein [Bacillota bacterium]HPZ11830.1 corrinoid protein [Bacillota bacterium]
MSREALLQEAAAAIVERDPDRALAVARKALELGVDPLVVIEQGFTRGLIQVGDLFERGELFLPELIQCAEIMKSVSGMLNEAISVERREAAGRVVIATVEGDIHDIGKGIVVSLMRACGLEVHDLGRDVPAETIIRKAVELDADVIGTSALLTTTMAGQKELEEALRKAGLRERFITIVGGAPVTERWARRIGADAYAEDANDGVRKIFELLAERGR